MDFRTEVFPAESKFKINYHTPVLFIGSCFTEHIGSWLRERMMPVSINPFGVVYNPLSVARNLEILLENKFYQPEDLGFYNELHYSFDHHSSFSAPDQKDCLTKINQEISLGSEFLVKAGLLFISIGTAWVYRYKKTERLVCNCHKIPSGQFDRFRIDPSDVSRTFLEVWQKLKLINPGLKVVFTISPIRHWKDGAHGNQLSKSVLFLGIEEILRHLPGEAEYFPAYELMMDDLRDYRYYAEDMLHPNTLAIRYIRNKFEKTYLDEQSVALGNAIDKINQAAAHRPLNKNTKTYIEFIDRMKKRIEELQKEFPFLNMDSLRDSFQ